MTEVACKGLEALKSDRGRVCLKCNREVTWISRQRPWDYTRVTEFKSSYRPSVCCREVLLRSCKINILVVVSNIPVF